VDICVNAGHVFEMDDIVDTRGLKCPLPVLKIAKVLRDAPPDTVATVWADDPIAIIDIPHFCVEAGHQLVSQSNAGSHQIYVIKQTKLP
jgi:tRNA 2-thiouridine synthesizing protein A